VLRRWEQKQLFGNNGGKSNQSAVSVAAMRVILEHIDASSILKNRALLAFKVRCLWTTEVPEQDAHLGFLRVEIFPTRVHKV